MAWTHRALKVACPHCGAKVGQLCRTKWRIEQTYCHAARDRLWATLIYGQPAPGESGGER